MRNKYIERWFIAFAVGAAAIVLSLLLSGCATHRKPCQVERICLSHREDMIAALTNYPVMMRDVLSTIATLEQEAGGYK